MSATTAVLNMTGTAAIKDCVVTITPTITETEVKWAAATVTAGCTKPVVGFR